MVDLLSAAAVRTGLERLDGWEGSTERIHKTFVLEDFAEAMEFVNRVAGVAEEMNHHPDIAISWNRVDLDIRSHSAGGVTGQCLELAQRVEAVAR